MQEMMAGRMTKMTIETGRLSSNPRHQSTLKGGGN